MKKKLSPISYHLSAISYHSGFTLIEILVAVSIISLVFVSATQIFAFTLRSNQKARAIMDTKQTGDNALAIVSNAIRTASAITSDCATVPAASINLTATNGNLITFTCLATNFTMTTINKDLTTESSILIDGSADNLVITEPNNCFTCYETSGSTPPIVQISYTLQKAGANPASGIQLFFSTSVSLRNY